MFWEAKKILDLRSLRFKFGRSWKILRAQEVWDSSLEDQEVFKNEFIRFSSAQESLRAQEVFRIEVSRSGSFQDSSLGDQEWVWKILKRSGSFQEWVSSFQNLLSSQNVLNNFQVQEVFRNEFGRFSSAQEMNFKSSKLPKTWNLKV